ncbi:ABC transporter ATP-binding protein [Brevibacillus massiliensis]|jgi:peptide/nickel transport system ATP-binding protein/oligopeptide transport system ATP-binding protein|uniref:ABC transporter ATP-binding protein n=1 Tax=Brevibacillus massiliensis TaxID=1118054 RepID=UPI0002F95C79|nr:dipeptide ABC transporter ATP-binding protein [Brevibacillus massiliensis]
MEKLLEVKGLKTYFPIKKGVLGKKEEYVKAVDDVSFYLKEGETLGLVGESGCGKSTTGRSILQLVKPTAGEIIYQGQDLMKKNFREMREVRRDLQMIFQDPYSSLNVRMTIRNILLEPMRIHGLYTPKEREERVKDLLEMVGLRREHADRYPHEFSGGQRQRIGIARALTLQPKLIIADEPVSALDVSIQAQVLNLMQDLQEKFGLTYLFIAHDLSVVKHFSTRVGVMYLGRIVELADKKSLYNSPKHPYTESLLSAVPVLDPDYKKERIILSGDVPNPKNPPQGCAFHTRCASCMEICKSERPPLKELAPNHLVACHLY